MLALHVGIEGTADRFDDLVGGLLIDLVQDLAEWPEPGENADQLSFGKPADNVDGSDFDPDPAALLQDVSNSGFRREGELSRPVRPTRREARQMRGGGAFGRRHERIFFSGSPSDEPQRGARFRGTPQVREGLHGVIEKHDTETRHDPVETIRRKSVALRVGTDEIYRRAASRGTVPRRRDHRLREVDPDTTSRFADRPRDGERRAAGTTANVEHAKRRLGAERFEKQVLERLEHQVDHRLRFDPGMPLDPIPEPPLLVVSPLVCPLVGLWVGPACNIHDRLLWLAFEWREPENATSSRLEVKGMRDLDIAEVAKHSSVPASTLRYYEEKGLIASIGRRGLRRLFDPDVLERLALIALGRAAGFTLDEIAMMFAPDGEPCIDRNMLAEKAAELDRTIHQLSAMRDGLRHAAACPEPSHLDCPTFRRLLRGAASGVIRAPGASVPRPPSKQGRSKKQKLKLSD